MSNQLISQLNQQPAKYTTNSNELIQKLRVEGLFSKFTAIWGQKWLKPLEDDRVRNDAAIEWGSIISEFEDNEIIKAINRCKKLYDFPPSISQFMQEAIGIPSFSIVKNGGDNSQFYHTLMCRIDKFHMKQLSVSEANFYLLDKYNALKEETLLLY